MTHSRPVRAHPVAASAVWRRRADPGEAGDGTESAAWAAAIFGSGDGAVAGSVSAFGRNERRARPPRLADDPAPPLHVLHRRTAVASAPAERRPDPVPTATQSGARRLVARDERVNPLGGGDWRAARGGIAAVYAKRGFRPCGSTPTA